MAYSQGKEEQFIWEFFDIGNDNPANRVYVELGAYDGLTNSNTRALQLIGWAGVCIEPNPTAFKQLLKNRADDETACYDVACVSSDKVKQVVFTVFDTIPQFSGVTPDINKTLPETRALGVAHNPKRITVKAKTLDAILLDYFDGEDGADSVVPGPPGYTPVKGVDYFDGAPGTPGSDATVTKIAVEAVLTGQIDTHSHEGGGLTQSQILTRQL
jgi:FkbM family methyltransferase